MGAMRGLGAMRTGGGALRTVAAGGRTPPVGTGMRAGAGIAGVMGAVRIGGAARSTGRGPFPGMGARCTRPTPDDPRGPCPAMGPGTACPTTGIGVGARAPSATAVDGRENCCARAMPAALASVA
jgi:hypothetical protein